MKKLEIYLLRRFCVLFFFLVFSLYILYVVIDVLNHLDYFLEKEDVNIWIIAEYYLRYFPILFIQWLNIFTISTTTVIFTINLKKYNELNIITTSGINLLRVISPLIIFCFFLGIADSLMRWEVIPEISTKFIQLQKLLFKNKEKEVYLNLSCVIKKKKEVFYWYSYKLYPNINIASYVSVVKYQKNKFIWRIVAEKGKYQNHRWILKKVSFQDNPLKKVKNFSTFIIFLPSPREIIRLNIEPIYLSYKELKNNHSIRTNMEIWYRLLYPISYLVLFLTIFTLSIKISHLKMVGGILGGVICTILYYGIWFLFLHQGLIGKISPLASNIIPFSFSLAISGFSLLVLAKKLS